MKTIAATFPGNRRRQGGTLIEVMFVSAMLMILVGAILSAHLLGLREEQWVESKAGASDTSRKQLNQLPYDIRAAKMWLLGNMVSNNFVPVNNAATGKAVKFFSTTNNSTPYTVYYFDLSNAANNDGHLLRFTDTSPTPVVIASNLVSWLTNGACNGYSFCVEDYNGNATTNAANSAGYKQVIHVMLQFCQFLFPLTPVGTNGLYDYYKLEFRATPHLPE